MSMDNEQFEAIKSRAVVGIELINTLDPYVTGNGGIVLLYGPYSPVKAQSIADYYRRLSTDVPALIAEVERLRAANARLVAALTGLRDLAHSFLMDDHPAAVAADKAIAESEAIE